jgi:GMP synthase (glutamine-hydrolysing)
MHIVVLRAGDVVAAVAARRGEYDAFIRRGVEEGERGEHGDSWQTVDLRSDAPFDEVRADAFIVTGSSSSVVERAPWMESACVRLRRVVEAGTPVLGICFGHQLLAHAFGGRVEPNASGREIGTVGVRIKQADPLFDGLPDPFFVQTTHVDSVTRLPEGARVLAETDLEPVAAYALGERTRAVQFHPELDDDAMRAYLDARAERVRAEGLDLERLVAAVQPTPAGATILKNFRTLLASR